MTHRHQKRSNVDPRVVEGFGDEWTRLDQSDLTPTTRDELQSAYFRLFPWDRLGVDAVGADFGCGSGRWAIGVAERVATLYCVDASERALEVARRNLRFRANCVFMLASVADLPIPDGSLDFGYSLGVLHHIPDTQAGLASCVRKLKPNAPFLLYLYYRFDNRPRWYRGLWSVTDMCRALISKLPSGARYWTSQAIALTVYWPLARVARLAHTLGLNTSHYPLSFYANKPFYVMRTDSLDRFGTRLERRFTRAEIELMMRTAGLRNISFSTDPPFWCAVGFRSSEN